MAQSVVVTRLRIVYLLLIVVLAVLFHRGQLPPFNRPPDSVIAEINNYVRPARSEQLPAEAPLPDESTYHALPPERDSSAQAPSLGFDSGVYLAELPAQLDDLAVRADAGDARALTDVGEWLDYCERVRSTTSRAQSGPAYAALADTTLTAYFISVADLCNDWIGRHVWLSRTQAEVAQKRRDYMELLRTGKHDEARALGMRGIGDAIRQRAAKAGDDIALSLTGDTPASSSCPGDQATMPLQQRQAYNQCVHALARERLLLLLRSGDARLIEAVPAIMTTYGFSLLSGSEFMRESFSGEREARWTLAACGMGLDCGPTSRTLRWACTNGACGYDSYRDYMADRRLPPATMRLVEGQVPRLLGLIQTGNVDAILGPPPAW